MLLHTVTYLCLFTQVVGKYTNKKGCFRVYKRNCFLAWPTHNSMYAKKIWSSGYKNEMRFSEFQTFGTMKKFLKLIENFDSYLWAYLRYFKCGTLKSELNQYIPSVFSSGHFSTSNDTNRYIYHRKKRSRKSLLHATLPFLSTHKKLMSKAADGLLGSFSSFSLLLLIEATFFEDEEGNKGSLRPASELALALAWPPPLSSLTLRIMIWSWSLNVTPLPKNASCDRLVCSNLVFW